MIEKEYTQKNKIIICKYDLKDKCKFGRKCNFLHIQKYEIEHTLEEVIKLRSENTSLKSEFYKMVQEKRKLNHHETRNVVSEVYGVYALQKAEKKSSYSSLFKEKTSEEKKSDFFAQKEPQLSQQNAISKRGQKNVEKNKHFVFLGKSSKN